MARPVTLLAFFFISLSLFGGFLQATGIAATMGLDARYGSNAQETTEQTLSEVDTGAPTGQTLFGLYNVLAGQLSTLLGVVNPGLRMLYNAGVPAQIVGGPNTIGLLPPLTTFVKGVGIMSFLRGWGL